jgi:hypothetical protein
MQVNTLQALRSTGGNERASGTALAIGRPAAGATAPAAAVPGAASARPLRATTGEAAKSASAFSPWDGERHGQVAAVQMAKAYLGQLSAGLHTLKSGYSENLADPATAHQREGELASARQGLQTLWRQRAAATSAAIDPQLQYQGHGAARQAFRIRGIDAAALSQGAREVLSIGLPSNLAGPLTVTIDPEQGVNSNLRRLDHALATADVRVHIDDRGEPMFSAPEATWDKVQDRITIKGEGHRFADGVPQRVRTHTEAPALPSALYEQAPVEPHEIRGALQRVIHALDRVGVTQAQVAGALALASAEASAASAEIPAESVERAAQAFLARTQSMRFETSADVAPALAGVNRARVMALLG